MTSRGAYFIILRLTIHIESIITPTQGVTFFFSFACNTCFRDNIDEIFVQQLFQQPSKMCKGFSKSNFFKSKYHKIYDHIFFLFEI